MNYLRTGCAAYALVLQFSVAIMFANPANALENDTSLDAELSFDVFAGDKRIGTHTFDVETTNGIRVVTSLAKFKVTVLFIPAYRYEHSSEEHWVGNCLLDIDARTNANGKQSTVSGTRSEQGFHLERDPASTALPDCIMTFAYWNPDFLQQSQLLNPQTGEFVEVDIREIGADDVKVRGQLVAATRFELTSPDGLLTLWYSDSSEWLALESLDKDGRTIRYERS